MIWETAPKFDWSGTISNRAAKEEVGRELAAKVKDGDVIGVGSGSTAYLAILAIAERVRKENLRVAAVCTSPEVTLACAANGLPVTSLLAHQPGWAFDGADEVDPNHDLIKGRGGAMYLEKVVFKSCSKNYVLADKSKLVSRLGEKFPVPVEVLPIALHVAEKGLLELGATEIKMRPAGGKDGPVITECGNIILDVRFPEISKSMERDIKSITGVIESGLFIDFPVEVLIA